MAAPKTYHKYKPRKAVPIEEKITPRMRELAAQALDNQLKSGDPAFVGETLDRLLSAGMPRHLAMEKIKGVLTRHLYMVMHDKKQFNEGRYRLDLDKLK